MTNCFNSLDIKHFALLFFFMNEIRQTMREFERVTGKFIGQIEAHPQLEAVVIDLEEVLKTIHYLDGHLDCMEYLDLELLIPKSPLQITKKHRF